MPLLVCLAFPDSRVRDWQLNQTKVAKMTNEIIVAFSYNGELERLYTSVKKSCEKMSLLMQQETVRKNGFYISAAQNTNWLATKWPLKVKITAESIGETCSLAIQGVSTIKSLGQSTHDLERVQELLSLIKVYANVGSGEVAFDVQHSFTHNVKKKRVGIGHIILVGFISLIAIGWLVGKIPNLNLTDPIVALPKDKVVLSSTMNKGGFGNILLLDLVFTNLNTFSVKDIVINCDGFASSGTKIDNNNKTIYERLGAGETRAFKKFNMGFLNSQVVETRCTVESVN